MAARLVSILPRFAIVTFVFLFATAAVTFAAGKQIASNPAKKAAAAPAAPATLVVPDVRNQAFVFAKGSLEDAGFAWRVAGSVHGFAANTVTAQSPAAGVRVIDTGAPLDDRDARPQRALLRARRARGCLAPARHEDPACRHPGLPDRPGLQNLRSPRPRSLHRSRRRRS